MRNQHLLLFSLMSVVFMHCATVGNGPMQRVHVESDPPAAIHTSACGLWSTKAAETPATIWVNRRATQCRLHLEAAGYEPQTIRLVRRMSRRVNDYPASLQWWCRPEGANCNSLSDLMVTSVLTAVFFVPGLAVDFATGSIFELNPSLARVRLQQESDER